MAEPRPEEIKERARHRMGVRWRQRTQTALDILMDAEGAMHRTGVPNIGSAICDVATALRIMRTAGETKG